MEDLEDETKAQPPSIVDECSNKEVSEKAASPRVNPDRSISIDNISLEIALPKDEIAPERMEPRDEVAIAITEPKEEVAPESTEPKDKVGPAVTDPKEEVAPERSSDSRAVSQKQEAITKDKEDIEDYSEFAEEEIVEEEIVEEEIAEQDDKEEDELEDNVFLTQSGDKYAQKQNAFVLEDDD